MPQAVPAPTQRPFKNRAGSKAASGCLSGEGLIPVDATVGDDLAYSQPNSWSLAAALTSPVVVLLHREAPGDLADGWSCEALGVSRGGFYAWLTRPRRQRDRHEELSAKVRAGRLCACALRQ